jgi:hypothetical protein
MHAKAIIMPHEEAARDFLKLGKTDDVSVQVLAADAACCQTFDVICHDAALTRRL